MNRTQTLAVAVLATLLPFAQTAFASDREHADRGHGRTEQTRGHGQDRHHGQHDRHHYRHHDRHHGRHHGRHDDQRYRHYQSNYNQGGHVGVSLPLPPFPVIVLNKNHRGGHIELPHPH